uniref:Myb-like domain-containing protein n=1 Tax=Oryza nivara TaxID=4536 RepID=A0A0E0IQY6_ORYNI
MGWNVPFATLCALSFRMSVRALAMRPVFPRSLNSHRERIRPRACAADRWWDTCGLRGRRGCQIGVGERESRGNKREVGERRRAPDHQAGAGLAPPVAVADGSTRVGRQRGGGIYRREGGQIRAGAPTAGRRPRRHRRWRALWRCGCLPRTQIQAAWRKKCGMGAGRKLKTHRRNQRWADKAYKKSHLGNEWKKPFAGSSHAKGIVLEKIGIEAKQPNSAICKCARVQLVKNGKKIAAFVPNDALSSSRLRGRDGSGGDHGDATAAAAASREVHRPPQAAAGMDAGGGRAAAAPRQGERLPPLEPGRQEHATPLRKVVPRQVAPPPRPRDVYHRPFTARDDDELLRLHYRLGDRWKEIGRAVYGRTSRVMKHRWRELRRGGFLAAAARKEQAALDMADDTVETSEVEEPADQSLPSLELQRSTLADTLASSFGSCSLATDHVMDPLAGSLALGKYQFFTIINIKDVFAGTLVRHPWLPSLVKENGFRRWSRVTRSMPRRSARLCRDRWCHHLARDVYHRPFTARDDDELLRLHYRLGDRWKKIGHAVYGRTSCVMNHRWRELRRSGFLAAAARTEQTLDMADDTVESEMEESDQSLPTTRKSIIASGRKGSLQAGRPSACKPTTVKIADLRRRRGRPPAKIIFAGGRWLVRSACENRNRPPTKKKNFRLRR